MRTPLWRGHDRDRRDARDCPSRFASKRRPEGLAVLFGRVVQQLGFLRHFGRGVSQPSFELGFLDLVLLDLAGEDSVDKRLVDPLERLSFGRFGRLGTDCGNLSPFANKRVRFSNQDTAGAIAGGGRLPSGSSILDTSAFLKGSRLRAVSPYAPRTECLLTWR